MLCAYDASPRPLTQKVLERPRSLIQRIRNAIPDPNRAYLSVFNPTPLEGRLAVLLGIPLNGLDPSLSYLGTKSGSRKIFREAGVDLPEGFEDLRSLDDVEEALIELKRRRPGLRHAIVKLNDSFSGEGNAIFTYPEEGGQFAVRGAMEQVQLAVPSETAGEYYDKFVRMGGVAEELIEVCARAPSPTRKKPWE